MRQGGETGRVVELAASDVLTKEVLVWKGLHLFHFSGSSCSQKLRIYLNLKGIAPSLHPGQSGEARKRDRLVYGHQPARTGADAH